MAVWPRHLGVRFRSADGGTARRHLAVALLALPLGFPLVASATESPVVYEGSNPTAVYEITSASDSFELWLRIGGAPSNQLPNLCETGDGDEICGFTIVIEPTGSLTIDQFFPVAELVTNANPAVPGSLKINHVGPVIDHGRSPFHLGTVYVSVGGTVGTLEVSSESQAVSADLQLIGVIDNEPIARFVPEPSAICGLAAGILMLWLLSRRSRGQSLGIMVTALAIFGAGGARAQIYIAQLGFQSAIEQLGASHQRIGFETIPTEPALGEESASFSNGFRARQATFRSSSLQTDVALKWGGASVGLTGTFLVRFLNPTRGNVAWPGGTTGGINNPESNDDVRIEFDHPVRAAGLRIVQNPSVAGDTISFEGRGGVAIASTDLGVGFRGYIQQEGDPPIAAIVIRESDSDQDDIGIDDVIYAAGGSPFADQVISYDVVDSGSPEHYPEESARISTNALNKPNGNSVSLGNGGQIVLRFADNSLRRSGDDRPDLRIHEAIPPLEPMMVEVSANNATWYGVGGGPIEPGGISDIDIDPWVPDHEYHFVRIIDVAEDEDAVPTIGADIDAVEALSGRILPTDSDDDHVPDSYDDCPFDYDPSQSDVDADGVGDICDNCIETANPAPQFDTDGDDVGDACEPAIIRLVREFDSQQTSFPFSRLDLECGAGPIEEILIGIWLPPGLTVTTFGSGLGCGLPGNPPPGVKSGPGCPPGSVPNYVLRGASGVFTATDTAPPNQPPLPFRSDVVYVNLHGNPLLCEPGNPNRPLIAITATAGPGGGTRVMSLDFEGAIAGLGNVLSGPGGVPVERFQAWLTNTSGPGLPASISLLLEPGDCTGTIGAANVWQARIDGEQMHRVTMGLLGPELTDENTLYILGCEDMPLGGTRTCDGGEIGGHGNLVDEIDTFTHGPVDPATSPLLADTLYGPLEGGSFRLGQEGEELSLNPFPRPCIAEIINGFAVFSPPIFVRDGFSVLAYHDSNPEPFLTVDDLPIAGDAVYEGITFNASSNIDGDTVIDGETAILDTYDNCPFQANNSQGDADEDGQGNACECGDANPAGSAHPEETMGDGIVNSLDLVAIRQYLVGLRGEPHIEMLCSVAADAGCDALDAVVLWKALQDQTTDSLDSRCDAALPD